PVDRLDGLGRRHGGVVRHGGGVAAPRGRRPGPVPTGVAHAAETANSPRSAAYRAASPVASSGTTASPFNGPATSDRNSRSGALRAVPAQARLRGGFG